MKPTGLLKKLTLTGCVLCALMFAGCVGNPSGNGTDSTGTATAIRQESDTVATSDSVTTPDSATSAATKNPAPGAEDAGEEDVFGQ